MLSMLQYTSRYLYDGVSAVTAAQVLLDLGSHHPIAFNVGFKICLRRWVHAWAVSRC